MKERKAKVGEHEIASASRRGWPGYTVAVAGTAVAALVRWALLQAVGDLPPYITFYPVVFAAAIVGGTKPGLLATVLCLLTADWSIIAPVGALGPRSMGDAVGMVLFIALNFGISVLAGRFRMQSEALRRSEQRFRALVTAGSYAVYRMSPDWSELRELRGRDLLYETATPSRTWLQEYVDPEDQPHVTAAVNEAIRTRSPFELEHRVRRVDGTFRWTFSRAVPLLNANGEIVEWVGAASDITQRKQAEQAVRESEERFRTMADAIPQLAWVARPDGHVFWFNRRSYEYSGATPEQLEGWAWQSVVEPQVLPRVLEEWRRSIASGEPFEMEFPLRGADGRFRPFLTRVMPLKDKKGQVTLWFGTHTDIAELQGAKEAMRQSEERLRTLIEQAPTAIGVSRNGITLYVNQKYVELFGCQNADEQVGRPIIEGWAPEWQAVVADYVRQRSLGLPVPTTYEGVAQRQDGSRFPAHADVALVNLSDGPASLAFITDITERKRLQEHLEEAVAERTARLHEALAELEHMSYSMVHDMRAPLRAMQSFAGILQEECADCRRSPGLDYLQRICESSNRLDRLITDALNYNKVVRENLPITPVELGTLLRGMVQTYPNLQPPAADIRIDLADLVVLGNESLLTQCFGNLLDNAVKFVAPGVRPCIRVWAEPVRSAERGVRNEEEQTSPPHSALRTPHSAFVRVWVEDNGIGIAKEAQEKIFLMFQRMHGESEYPGTGIGLTIVRKAVERMGGVICLDSEPGKGTRFCVELPRPAEAQERVES